MKSEHKAKGVGRREFLRTLGVGTAAAAQVRRSSAQRVPTPRAEMRSAKPATSRTRRIGADLLSRQSLSRPRSKGGPHADQTDGTTGAARARLPTRCRPRQTGGVDRRAFLRRSGLVAGSLAALGRLAARQHAQVTSRSSGAAGRDRPRSRRTSARSVRSAARWRRRSPTAYGSVRSPPGIRRSIAARIAPRVRRLAKSCLATAA